MCVNEKMQPQKSQEGRRQEGHKEGRKGAVADGTNRQRAHQPLKTHRKRTRHVTMETDPKETYISRLSRRRGSAPFPLRGTPINNTGHTYQTEGAGGGGAAAFEHLW